MVAVSRRMKSFLHHSLLVVGSILIALGVAEGVVRIALPAPPPRPDHVERALPGILLFDPELETRYQPNAQTRIRSQYGEFDIRYEINELGLRDRSLSRNALPQLRVLALGNSFVEGWGVSDEDSFLRIAERRLADRPERESTRSIRLVNGGISGYGAAQSYLFFQRLLDKVRPDLVVFFYVSTMVYEDHRFLARAEKDPAGLAMGLSIDALLQDGGPPSQASSPHGVADLPAVQLAAEYSALARLLAARFSNRLDQQRIAAGDPQTDLLAGLRADPETLPELHRPSLQHVRAIARLSATARLPFLLVHLPLPHQLSPYEWDRGRTAYRLEEKIYPAQDRAVVSEFCRLERLQCLAAHDVLQKGAARSKADPKLFYDYDFHLNATGNQLLGEWLQDQLRPLLRKRWIEPARVPEAGAVGASKSQGRTGNESGAP